MKINPNFRPMMPSRLNEQQQSQQTQTRGFSDFFQQQGEETSVQQLQNKMQAINIQGDRLSKSMTIRELYAYKQLVKRFLEETVKKGVGLKDTRGWDSRGRGKRYKILDTVNATLLTMADALLDTETGRIEILQKVGDIKGMLCDFFF
jgi:uncharacterized protein YaaR (DUF327 family)